jgi:hypothetical protein
MKWFDDTRYSATERAPREKGRSTTPAKVKDTLQRYPNTLDY